MAAEETPTPTGQAALLRELGTLIGPLEDLASGAAATALVRSLGLRLPGRHGVPVDFGNLLDDVTNVGEDVVALEQAADDDAQLEAGLQLALDLVPLIEQIVKLEQELEHGLAAMQALLTQSDITTELPKRLLDYLVLRYLVERAGPTFDLLLLAGLVDFTHQEADAAKFELEVLIPTVHWERIPKLFSKPSSLLDDAYDWSTNFNADLFVVRLGGAGRRLGLPVSTAAQNEAVAAAIGRPEGSHELRLALLQSGGPLATAYGELGLRAFALPPSGGAGPGISVMPYVAGGGAVTGKLGAWDVELDTTLDLSGGVAATIRPPNSLEVSTDLLGAPGTTTDATLALRVRRKSESVDGMILLGSPGATRMSVSELGLGFATSLGAENEVLLEVEIVDLLILVPAGDGDGFLQRILPGDGIKAQASLDASYSSLHGLKLKGSGSLEVDLPIGLEIAGIIRIDDLIVALGFSESELTLSLAVNGSLQIGPVAASVEGIGIRAALEPKTGPQRQRRAAGGAGGFQAADRPRRIGGRRPCGGRGIPLLQGADGRVRRRNRARVPGFPFRGDRAAHNEDAGRLAWLLADRRSIAAEFNPIQLGYGFTLNGVGGLVGINRGINVDFLRQDSRTERSTRSASRTTLRPTRRKIISDLRNTFPVQEDEYVFGPMVEDRLGRVDDQPRHRACARAPVAAPAADRRHAQAALPPAEDEAVLLQLDILGVIDFDKGEVSFDGALRDSRVAVFPFTGEMAMRCACGAEPDVRAVGGRLPPELPAAAGLPEARRVWRSRSRTATTRGCGSRPTSRSPPTRSSRRPPRRLRPEGPRVARRLQRARLPRLRRDAQVLAAVVRRRDRRASSRQAQRRLLRRRDVDMTLSGPQPWHAVGDRDVQNDGLSASVGLRPDGGRPAAAVRAGAGRSARAATGRARATTATGAAGAPSTTYKPWSRCARRRPSEGRVLVHPLGIADRAPARRAARLRDRGCTATQGQAGDLVQYRDDQRGGQAAGPDRAAGPLRARRLPRV